MRPSWLPLPIALVSLALSVGAVAQDEKSEDKPDAPKDDGPRKDPQGIKGISPFWEDLKRGDNAYVARDFDGAIAAYKDALRKEPQNALGHYRIGEAHLAKNDLREAEQAWVAALRFVGAEHTLKAKILFCLADLRERQKAYDDAKDSWNKYAEFAKSQPEAKTYPNTPPERQKVIDNWKKMLKDYAAVKKRIEKRLREVDKKKK